MKTNHRSLSALALLAALLAATAQGCKSSDATPGKDSADAVKSFTGKVPPTEESRRKQTEIMQKAKEWGDKMKADGKAGAGAPK